jgi:hypothetical protein
MSAGSAQLGWLTCELCLPINWSCCVGRWGCHQHASAGGVCSIVLQGPDSSTPDDTTSPHRVIAVPPAGQENTWPCQHSECDAAAGVLRQQGMLLDIPLRSQAQHISAAATTQKLSIPVPHTPDVIDPANSDSTQRPSQKRRRHSTSDCYQTVCTHLRVFSFCNKTGRADPAPRSVDLLCWPSD